MEAQPSGRTVVLGIDGSRSALRAVQWAAAEAARRNLPVRIVMALEWQRGRAYGRLGADYRQIMLGEGERLLGEAVAVAEKTMPVTEVEHELILGSPIPVLRTESRTRRSPSSATAGTERSAGCCSGRLRLRWRGKPSARWSSCAPRRTRRSRTEPGRSSSEWTVRRSARPRWPSASMRRPRVAYR